MPISDNFSSFAHGLNSPVQGGFDITPADNADLEQVTRGVMVSGAGDLAVTFKNGDALILTGLAAGVIYPLRVTQVQAAGTTATGIKGLV